MKILFTVNKIYKIFARTVKIMTGTVIGIFVLAFLLIQIPGVQNYIGQRVLAKLSDDLSSPILAHNVAFNFHEVTLDGITVHDQMGDTLFSSSSLHVNYNLLPILNQKISLNVIELNEGTILAHRQEGAEEFNYQFLLDYFAGDDTSAAKSIAWTVDLEEVRLNNSSIVHWDAANDQKFTLNTPEFHADIQTFDLEEQQLEITQLTVAGSDIAYLFNSATNTNDLPAMGEMPTNGSQPSSFPNPTGWEIEVVQLDITDSDLAYTDKAAPATPQKVNPSDLHFSSFHFRAKELTLLADTAFGKVDALRFREHSGFRIDSFSGDLKASPRLVALDELTIQTGHSTIRRSFSLAFNDISDFSEFIRKVRFEASFDKSKVATEDLLYFLDELEIPQEDYYLDGIVSGTVGNLKGEALHLRYAEHTDFQGSFSIMGLPNTDQAYIDFSVDQLKTNYEEFDNLLPFASLPANTKKLGVVRFNGLFNGFLRDFVAYGQLTTALGSMETDINMKTPIGSSPAYSGNLKVKNFHAGKYIDDPLLGRITFNADLEGEGFKTETLVANADGIINQIDYNDYAYKDIDFNGTLKQRFFSGDFNINDPNLVMDFHGTVDFNAQRPAFSIEAMIHNLETGKLKLTDENLKVTTNVTANFEGATVDDLVGNLKLANTNVYTRKSFYRVGDVTLEAENYSLGKRMMLQSSIVDAQLDGKFDITMLPSTMLGFLSNYYPSVLNYSSAYASGQDFMFNVDIKTTNNLTDWLLSDIQGIAGTNISGNFNSTYRRIMLNAEVPSIEYQGTTASDLSLSVRSTDDTLYFDTDVGELTFPNNLSASHHVKGKVYNNNVFVNLHVYEDSLINNLLANAVLTNVGDSIKVQVLDSRMEIDGREWKIKASHALYFYRDLIYADDLEFTSGEEKITVDNTDSDKDKGKGLRATLSNVNLTHLMNILGFKDYELAGALSGELAIFDVYSEARSIESDISVADFSIDRDTFGTFTAKAGMSFSEFVLNLDAGLSGSSGDFQAQGNMNVNTNDLDFQVDAANAPFKLLEPFMTGILSEMDGRINGSVNVAGSASDPDMSGKLTVNKGQAKVDYLNAKYYFEPMNVEFTNNSIYIKNTPFRDGLKTDASKADIGGEIYMKDFANIEFRDFYIHTDHNFKFMETTRSNNDLFYGSAYGKGIMLINGPLSRLDVYVNAVTDNNTKVFIPIVYETNVSQYDFVRFVNRDSTGTLEDKIKDEISHASVNFTMDLDVTPDAEVQMIFDEQAGDIIRGRGEGSLKMNFNTDGDFEMYGGINIMEGDYLFTLKDVVSKKFVIQRGGTITWTGDPYEANLNLIADYTKKVSGYNLVSHMSDQLSTAEQEQLKSPTPYTVELHMTGSLSNPDINFDIKAEEEDESVSNLVTNRLQEIREDQNELNKQVFGLIVFNSFLPAEMRSSHGSGTLLSSGVGTITEFLSNQLSIYFNDWLSKYDMEVDIQYRNYNIESTEEVAGLKRNELDLELRKKIGRLYVNVGGNFDFGNTSRSVSNANNVAGDFSVEYSLTEDGRFRVRAFRDSDYDLFRDAYRNKGGVGLFYRKEFNSFKELFTSPQSSREEPVEVEEKETKQELGAAGDESSGTR